MPHEKYDAFASIVKHMQEMGDSVRIKDCPCRAFVEEDSFFVAPEDEEDRKAICLWPNLHGDILDMKKNGEYRFVPMGQLTADALRTRLGARQTAANALLNQDDIIEKSCTNIDIFSC